MQHALAAGVLAGVAAGIMGTYVVTRRITYIGGGIAHATLAGMGVAYYLETAYRWRFIDPFYGAVASALLAAVIIGLISIRARQREDTVISALWALGMAIGVIFIARTPGYTTDLMSYLFGNILMVSGSDLILLLVLDAVVVLVSLLFYNQLVAVCFDEEFARLRGVNVQAYYLLLLILVALTVVILTTVVGLVLVVALLTLPSAVAGYFTNRLNRIMILAALLAVVFTVAGLAASYSLDVPGGATIIVFAGVVYLVTTGLSWMRHRRLG